MIAKSIVALLFLSSWSVIAQTQQAYLSALSANSAPAFSGSLSSSAPIADSSRNAARSQSGSAPALPTAAAPVYEVFAIRYASIPDFPVNALIAGADPQRKLSIAMTVWLIRGNGRNILVDSGFYRPQFFKQFKVDGFIKASETVGQAGIMPAGQPTLTPDDITDVVITHMHWDHADGMDLFPKARIWLQKDEYTYYTGEAWQSPRTHGGIDPDDVLAAVKLNLASRVTLHSANTNANASQHKALAQDHFDNVRSISTMAIRTPISRVRRATE
jgi:hypothetical protein